MKLMVVEEGANEVCDIVENDEPEALGFLSNAAPDMQATAKGFRALFRRYAEGGRNKLTAELFHEVDSENGIWEFVRGRLRVFCFMDGGRLLILTHGSVKKSQKVAPQEVARAARRKDAYLADKASDHIAIERNENAHR